MICAANGQTRKGFLPSPGAAISANDSSGSWTRESRRLEESPGPEQTPLRLRPPRLEELPRVARLSAVPGVGAAHAETVEDRNSARRAEKLQGVVVRRSLS